jgi:hypothetical protein
MTMTKDVEAPRVPPEQSPMPIVTGGPPKPPTQSFYWVNPNDPPIVHGAHMVLQTELASDHVLQAHAFANDEPLALGNGDIEAAIDVKLY